MDRNSIIGFILIGILIVVYTVINQPTEQELAKIEQQRDSIARVEQARKEQEALASNPIKNEIASNNSTTSVVEQLYYLENDLVKVSISNHGGRIVSVELKKYDDKDGKPVVLWKGEKKDYFALLLSKAGSVYNSQSNSFEIVNASKNRLILSSKTPDNGEVKYTYTLAEDSYEVGFDIDLNNINPDGIPQKASFLWAEDIVAQEKGRKFENNYTGLYYKEYEEDVESLSEYSEDEEKPEEKITWLAFKSQFFSSALITQPENSFSGVELKSTPYAKEESKYLKRLSAQVPLNYDGANIAHFPLKFYFGPNDYKILRSYGKDIDLHRLVNLGWGPFGWINRFVVLEVFNFLEKFVTSNYGIIILLLTLIIKLVLSPLTYKSYVSAAKMRVLKPQIEEINNKIPKEKAMERQQATMGLYRKVGVNPLGGCVPVLVQMPILIAMFRFFPVAIQLRHKSFLWATDLSSYDNIANLPFNIPFYGDHVSLFCLLMAITTLIYNYINMQNQPSTSQQGMPNMKFMTYLMPIVFMGMFNQYAAGLSYYYFISTLFTIIQTLIIRKFMIDDKKLLAKLEENKAKPSKPKSKFRQRLEEMQKQQQQQAQRRKK